MHILFQCLGITGFIFLFYGFLAYAITQASESNFFRALIALGILGVTAFIIYWIRQVVQKPSMLRDMFQSRSTKSGAGAVVYSIIVILLIAVVNVYSSKRFNFQKDFTESNVHTLSEQSVKVMEGLSSELKVIAFMDERNQQKPVAKDLLKKYQSHSSQLKVEFVDADKQKLLAEKYGAKDGDVLIEMGTQSHLTQDVTEQGLTQAFLKVARTSNPMLCFTKGHGELDTELPAEDPRSLSYLKQGLQNEGFTFQPLTDLAGGIDEKCSILFIAGPSQAFTENEAGAVESYLAAGGNALFLLDPEVSDPKLVKGKLTVLPTGFEALFASRGIALGSNVVLEKQLQLFSGMQVVPTVRITSFGNHPVVEPLKGGRSVVFDRARSVQAKSTEGNVTELLFSAEGERSWSQSNVDALFRERKVALSDSDIQGKVPLGVAATVESADMEGESKESKLVVFGDADFASNALIAANEFNFDLVLNAISWLGGQSQQISIRPKSLRSSAIELTPTQANNMFYVAIIALPMLVLTFGMNLWWYRRRKG